MSDHSARKSLKKEITSPKKGIEGLVGSSDAASIGSKTKRRHTIKIRQNNKSGETKKEGQNTQSDLLCPPSHACKMKRLRSKTFKELYSP